MEFLLENLKNTKPCLTLGQLEDVSRIVLDVIKVKNNDKVAWEEVKNDTIAIGLLDNNEIVVACNTKERKICGVNEKEDWFVKENKVRYSIKYVTFGIRTAEMIETIVTTIKECEIFKNIDLKLVVIEERLLADNLTNEDKKNDHNAKHAEMKILKYAMKEKQALKVVGVSKPPCKRCNQILLQHGVEISSEIGCKKVSNFKEITDDDFDIQIMYKDE